MSTLATLTPNLAGRYVTVALTGLPAGKAIELTRTDSNGTRRVRVPRGAVADAGGAYTVRDYEAALTGTLTYSVAGRRTNVVTNPGFETDTTGWTVTGTGAVLTRDTSVVWNGAASGKLVMPSGSAFLQMTKATEAPATPGDTWQLAATIRGVTGTYDMRVIDQAGATIFDAPNEAGADTWRFHQYQLTIPPGTTHVRAQVTLTAGTLYIDRVLLERAAAYDGYVEGTVDGPVTSAPTALTDATRPAGLWIHAAAYPTTLATFTGGGIVGSSWRPTRDTGAQLVDVIGRADAIDTGPALARTRTHTVDVRCDDLAAARSLEDLVAAARTLVVRHNTPGLDSTLTVESIDGPYQDPTVPRRWHVVLRGRETLTGPYLADPPT